MHVFYKKHVLYKPACLFLPTQAAGTMLCVCVMLVLQVDQRPFRSHKLHLLHCVNLCSLCAILLYGVVRTDTLHRDKQPVEWAGLDNWLIPVLLGSNAMIGLGTMSQKLLHNYQSKACPSPPLSPSP